MKFKSLMFAALISLGLALSPGVWAASVSVIGYTLTATAPLNLPVDSISVYQSGEGNAELQGNDVNLINGPNHSTIFPNVTDLSSYVTGFVVGNETGSSGTFTIAGEVWDSWDSIFVGLKQANSYAIFELTNAIVSGTWSTSCGGGNDNGNGKDKGKGKDNGPHSCNALSHAFVVGGTPITPPSEVPVPAAVWLFGSALTGLFGFSRKKLSV